MSLWDRLTGRVVDAAGLGQKKRAVAAGVTAFAEPVGDLRLEIAINSHPWLQSSAATSFLLSIWVAQTLQDMAAVLEATTGQHLGDTGTLPEATFALADGLYDGALAWIDHAQTAQAVLESNPAFELPVRLPAPAPRFAWVADAPPVHFAAAIAAATQLGTAVEDALNYAQNDRSRLARKYDGAFSTIEGAVRLARAKLEQVEAAISDRQAVRLGRDIWAILQEVVDLDFRAGQQAARPGIIAPAYDAFALAQARARRLPPPSAMRQEPQQGSAGTAPPRTAGPARPPVQARGNAPRTMPPPSRPAPPPPPPPTLGQRLGLTFDAWALTDQGAKSMYQKDAGRIAELEAFWRSDTNPAETYRLYGLITAAVQAGRVAVRPAEFGKTCPWVPTFVAITDVTIGTEQFTAGQLFTFRAGLAAGRFGRGFDRLGFVPGSQPGPRAAAAAGPPRIDTRHPDRGAASPGAQAVVRGDPWGTDMWRLTAAFQRPQRRANAADTERLRQLWRSDPDPERTIAVHEELLAAVRAGDVRQRGDESLRNCPWSQVYLAVNQVTIAGQRLEPAEMFALQVGVANGAFRRSVVRLGKWLGTTR